VLPLEPDELRVLFDLITTRMAMTIVISSWRAARYPANRNYILRNNAAAWARLQRVATLSRDQAALQIKRACHVG
jgi:hydroxylysine kinase